MRTPEVTALRREAPGRIAVDVDGRLWRIVPDDVVIACRLAAGTRLDRATLRGLRRALRRAEALATAGRALARSDFSARQLDERLRRAGMRRAEREDAVRVLVRSGAVDDARVAERRAASLAERGWGDAAIRWRLEQAGFDESVVTQALESLDPEEQRADVVGAGMSDPLKAARLLARRGFDAELVDRRLSRLDVTT